MAAGKTPAAGLNDRVLAKIFSNKDRSGPAYTARVIKIIDRRRGASLGVIRMMEDETRLMPIDRRGEEMLIERDATGSALAARILGLVGDGRRRADLGRAIRAFARPDAASLIADRVEALAARGGWRQPEPGARSSESGARGPEPGARSPEPGARSPKPGA